MNNCRINLLIGRFTGFRVLTNSIPKAGMSLPENSLSYFLLMHRALQRALVGYQEVGLKW